VGIAREFVPDVVFVFRGAFLWPRTVERLRTLGSVVIAWNNDDPFGPRHYLGAWRHFLRSVPHYDFVFAYRQTNLEELRRAGAKGTDLLRSSYVREINRPIENVKDSPYSSDISFIGHWEPDCREEAIAALMAASDIDFRLFGPLWERSKLAPAIMARWGQLPSPRGSEYNLALCSAKIALIFLSRLNRDTYTRRCFEIPAAGVFMLSEFTPEIAHLFEEDKEIVFFRSTVELLEKTRYYLTHEEERRRIAKAGRERLLRDGHEVGDRAIQILHLVETRFGQRLRGDSPRVGSEM
jgi:spore maturation protein CgeB